MDSEPANTPLDTDLRKGVSPARSDGQWSRTRQAPWTFWTF